jgi:poly-gamma-glutamate capsule biosynthesis protein CapA/YwtB (metallophosphatase superfamily)
MVGGGVVRVFLCGDVMLGRGVDQILPHPGNPALRERHLRDARAYVALAEKVNGRIPRSVDFAWPWGAALAALDAAAPDVRVVNLETTVTGCDQFAPGKYVHYRMNPANLPCLSAVRPAVCVLANNHVLDFGSGGLGDTLENLTGAGLQPAGAGRDRTEAWQPAIVAIGEGRRVLVCSLGMASSGIPTHWAATDQRPGVAFVGALCDAAADEIAARLQERTQDGDLTVASVHWGSNWGYRVHREQVRFAHRLVDRGVDLVHGHSSHHPRPVEVYRGKLILYGCGDFIDDYEGIGGYDEYRVDLRLAHIAELAADTGALARLRMLPLQARQLRLCPASDRDAGWLCTKLDRVSRAFGSRIVRDPAGALVLRWTDG